MASTTIPTMAMTATAHRTCSMVTDPRSRGRVDTRWCRATPRVCRAAVRWCMAWLPFGVVARTGRFVPVRVFNAVALQAVWCAGRSWCAAVDDAQQGGGDEDGQEDDPEQA